MLSICIGQTIVGIDQRAITVALPTLTTTFHTSLAVFFSAARGNRQED